MAIGKCSVYSSLPVDSKVKLAFLAVGPQRCVTYIE